MIHGLIALVLAAVSPAQAQAPSAEALALGQQLAEAGTLNILLPLVAAKETEEMVAARTELGAAEQLLLRETAAEVAKAGTGRLMAAMGTRYAETLSVDELRALVAFHRTKAAERYRAVQPRVIAGMMQAMGTMDLKADTMAAFCKKTGKGCETDAD